MTERAARAEAAAVPGKWRLVSMLCLTLVVASGAVVRWQSPGFDQMLGTDEADYVRAMSDGAAAAYLGSRERSGIAFATEVVDEYRRTGWARPFKRDWDADDAAGLRHYHPPLAFYPLGVLAGSGVTDERTLRTVPLATSLLACAAAFILALALLRGAAPVVQVSLATAAGLLTAASPYHAEASMTIGSHAAFSLLSTLTLVALTRVVQTSEPRWWIAACAAFGLAILTVPYWALLVPAGLVAWWLGVPRARRVRQLGIGLLAMLAATLVAWPPFVVEAAFTKPIFMYAGLIVNPLVEDSTPGRWLVDLARTHALLIALGLAGLAAAPLLHRDQLKAFLPAAIFVAGFIGLNLRVAHMKTLYASDVIAPMAALACALVGLAIGRLPRLAAATLAAGVAIAAATTMMWPRGPVAPETLTWRQPLRELNDDLAGKRVLVTPRPAGAMVKYYVPAATVLLDSNHPDDVAELGRAVESGQIDAVLRWGGTTEPSGVAAGLIEAARPAGTTRVDETPVTWWRIE